MEGKDRFFNSLTDDEIIKMIRNGDSSHFEELFHRYLPLVKNMVRDFYVQGFERDDFIQEARIVLNKTVLFFNAKRGHTFGNYFKLNLTNHFNSLVRKDMAKKRRIGRMSESLEGLLENGFSPRYIENYEGGMTFENALEVKECIPQYVESLSKFECQVLVCHLHQKDKEEIAAELNCDTIQVTNALDRCKRKLRQQFM